MGDSGLRNSMPLGHCQHTVLPERRGQRGRPRHKPALTLQELGDREGALTLFLAKPSMRSSADPGPSYLEGVSRSSEVTVADVSQESSQQVGNHVAQASIPCLH